MTVPQRSYSKETGKTTIDHCLTPPEAVDLIDFILKKRKVTHIWEPAAGQYETLMADRLEQLGYTVYRTDIAPKRNDILAFDFVGDTSIPIKQRAAMVQQFAPGDIQAIVTNPPHSLAAEFIELCRYLPWFWFLLLKLDREGPQEFRDKAFSKPHLFEGRMISRPIYHKLIPSRRIAYKMPDVGWESSPPFWTAWYFSRTFNGGSMPDVFDVEYNQPRRSGLDNRTVDERYALGHVDVRLYVQSPKKKPFFNLVIDPKDVDAGREAIAHYTDLLMQKDVPFTGIWADCPADKELEQQIRGFLKVY